MDMVGNFSSDRVHIVERYTFVDAKTMNYTSISTIRPWTIAARMVSRDRLILRGGAAQQSQPK